ncbi:Fibroblast growth factor receptor [Mizuhopecten yessoensis]|uniref:Fibroblast growth factor receptor n=2 Tax=Mizuhopecten yessoensis TaxID=6573 RepID=A0A210Q9J3_MIZYE|nr:Fibroblast growth factor receptor [Mizuhopecten yessoensis]
MTFSASLDWESLSETLPMKPDYIGDLVIGVVSAMVDTEYSRLPLQGTTKRENVLEQRKTYSCQGLSASNPVTNTELNCRLREDSFQLRIDSGDWFTFTFSAKTGGYRNLIDTNTGQPHKTEIYTGSIQTVKVMQFQFDFEDPVHCNSSCPSQPDLEVEKDITKSPIIARWSGWSDAFSGVADYTLEVFKLQPNRHSKILEEPDPLGPVVMYRMNHTNSSNVFTKTHTPSEPGMYSLILETRDVANNSIYVRRFVLYDPVSAISVSNNHRLFVSSAEADTGHNWQSWYGNATGGRTYIDITWKDYFLNKLHEDNYFLNSISPYPDQLDDGGRRGEGYKKILPQFEDNEGERQTAKIPNARGIVRFDTVTNYANDGGSSLANPPSSWRTLDGIKDGDTEYFDRGAIGDGSTAKVWVRAYDAMGNTKIESTLVHFDMSQPDVLTEPSIQTNIENGTFPFSSRINVACEDEHSGVYKIHWRLRMANNRSFVKMEGDAINPVQGDDCNRECYRTNIGERYNYSIEFDINHCWMRVPKENLETQVMELEMEILNSAMLSRIRVLTISSIRSYSGIEDYFGPMHIRMTRQSETGVSLSWDHAPSCYARDTILVVVVMPDNSTKTLRADKDADRFDITGLVAATRYPIQLYTVYIIDDEQGETIDSRVSNYVIETAKPPKSSGLSGGAIAGIVIVILLLIVIAIGVVLLWRTGKLTVLLERIRSRRDGEEAPSNGFSRTEMRENGHKIRGVENKTYSRSFNDDMIYYGEVDLASKPWALSRKDLSLEQEIKSGRFATIYRAKMFSRQHSDADTVVIKALKNNYSEMDLTLMKAKINFYGSEVGNHPNILKFIGAVDDIPMGPFMVLEYCENGTMKDYLTSKKDHVDEQVHERLFKFAFDVCKGMEFLASKKIVHRRLAARNILLTFLYEVKISGFGPVPNEEKDSEKGEKIPVKWLPPECIETRTTLDATEKTDVWSFGIVLWEIFTIGETPFADVRSANLLPHLKKGERPPAPEYADQKMYGTMKKCWHETPKKRPSFAKIRAELETLFVSKGSDEFYYDSKFIYDNNN